MSLRDVIYWKKCRTSTFSMCSKIWASTVEVYLAGRRWCRFDIDVSRGTKIARSCYSFTRQQSEVQQSRLRVVVLPKGWAAGKPELVLVFLVSCDQTHCIFSQEWILVDCLCVQGVVCFSKHVHGFPVSTKNWSMKVDKTLREARHFSNVLC